MNKKGYEFSFGWIFAIVVGGFFIFIAIYAATQLISTQKHTSDTIQAKQLGVILNPVAANIEDSKSAIIEVPSKTRIINGCNNDSLLGSQGIATSSTLGIGDANDQVGAEVSFKERYIFSDKEITGENYFYVLSKSFNFPFKVGDLMMMWGDEQSYCIISPPQSGIKEDLENLNLTNVKIVDNLPCPSTSKIVCFNSGSTECDINVNTNQKSITHKNKDPIFYYEDPSKSDYGLLYAGVFSDPEIYDCQIKRLMGRASLLAKSYENKLDYLSTQDCFSGNSPTVPLTNLQIYENVARSIENSQEMKYGMIENGVINNVENSNRPLNCKAF